MFFLFSALDDFSLKQRWWTTCIPSTNPQPFFKTEVIIWKISKLLNVRKDDNSKKQLRSRNTTHLLAYVLGHLETLVLVCSDFRIIMSSLLSKRIHPRIMMKNKKRLFSLNSFTHNFTPKSQLLQHFFVCCLFEM